MDPKINPFKLVMMFATQKKKKIIPIRHLIMTWTWQAKKLGKIHYGFKTYIDHINNHWNNFNSFIKVNMLASSHSIQFAPKKIIIFNCHCFHFYPSRVQMKEHMFNKKGHTTLMSYPTTNWNANAFFKKPCIFFMLLK